MVDFEKEFKALKKRIEALEKKVDRHNEAEEAAMKEEMDQLEKEQQEYLYGGRI